MKPKPLLLMAMLVCMGCGPPPSPVDDWEATRDVPALIAALHSGEQWIRDDAVGALGRVGDERAIVPLLEAMGPELDAVRVGKAWAIASIDPRWPQSRVVREHVPRLVAELKDPDGRRRELAVMVLARIGDPSLTDRLLSASGDVSLRVRQAALAAFAGQRAASFPRGPAFVAEQPHAGTDTTLAAAVLALRGEPLGTITSAFVPALRMALARLTQRFVVILVGLALVAVVFVPGSGPRDDQFMALGGLAIFSGPIALAFDLGWVKAPFVQGWPALGGGFAAAGLAFLWGLAVLLMALLLCWSHEEFGVAHAGSALRALHALATWTLRSAFVASGGVLISVLAYGATSSAALVFVALPLLVALGVVASATAVEWLQAQ